MENSAEKNHSQARCFARRHMSPAASAYHAYALAVSRASGVFYSDDRRDALEFGESEKGVSNRTIFELRRFLERNGWFVRIDKGKARKRNPRTGTFDPIRYRVLDHDEWAAAHASHCRFTRSAKQSVPPDAKTTSGPDAETTAGENPPDAISSVTCSNSLPHLTQFTTAPDANIAAKTVETLKTEREKEEEDRSPDGSPASAAFASLGTKPFGKPTFKLAWIDHWSKAGTSPDWIDVMEATVERAGTKNTPRMFFNLKRQVEDGKLKIRPYIPPVDIAKAKLLWTTAETSGWNEEEFRDYLHYELNLHYQFTMEDIAKLSDWDYKTALTKFQSPPSTICPECGHHGKSSSNGKSSSWCEHQQAERKRIFESAFGKSNRQTENVAREEVFYKLN